MMAAMEHPPEPEIRAGQARQEKKIGWLIFALLLASYAYFIPRWGDWNQNSRLSLVMAIVDRGTLYIDGYPDELLSTGDYAVYGGHLYSTKPPGAALLGVPVYGVTRLVADRLLAWLPAGLLEGNAALADTLAEGGSGLLAAKLRAMMALYAVTFCTVMVPVAAMGAALYRLLGGLVPARGPRVWAVLGYGLASNAMTYSGAFYSHQMVAYLTFFAFLLARRMRREAGRPGLALGVGVLLGYAVITEHPSALIAAGVAAYLLWGRREWRVLAALVAGGLLPGILWMAYNQAVYGAPIAFGYEYEPLFQDVNTTGFFSLVYPYPEALWGITFGSYRGLFFVSPLLLLAVPGFVYLARLRAWRGEFWLCLWALISFILFNGSSVMWQGGYGVGPRYLVPMLPYLALPLALCLDRWGRARGGRILALALTAWSVFAVWAETIGGQLYPDYTLNPLFNYSLPRVLGGDVARNPGLLLGLPGLASVLPLLALLAALGYWLARTVAAAPREIEVS